MTKSIASRTAACASLAGSLIMLAAIGPIAQDEAGAQEQPDFIEQFPVISIEFEGGTVADYVAVLRRAAENVNIMVDVDAGEVPLPAFELQSVMLVDALRVVEDLEPENESYELSMDEFASGPPEFYAPVYRIVSKKLRPPQPPLQTSVWSISALIERGVAAEDVLGAIETALGLQEDLGAPDVRFHEATGLILARAHPEQIATIGEVIHNLQSASAPRPDDGEMHAMAAQLNHARAEAEDFRQRSNMVEAQVRDLVQENERLQTRVQLLTAEIDRLRGENGGDNSGR
jgi:hypothetical protein